MKKLLIAVLAFLVFSIGAICTGIYFAMPTNDWIHYLCMGGSYLIGVPALIWWEQKISKWME